MDQLFKKPAVAGLLGIEISPDGIAVAHVSRAEQARPVVQSCRFLPNVDINPPPLGEYISEMGLDGALCNVVLPNSAYSLILTEAPEVEDAELADAMHWMIKDLIDFPLEEAVLDVFRLPADASHGSTKMVYVAVARRSLIQTISDLLNSAKVELGSIDIIELALRNLCLLFPEDSSCKAVVQLSPGTGNLNIIKNQQLYLSRRFDIDWEGGLMDPLPTNSLILELQRSLEYYERQMSQAPPSNIYLCGEGVSQDKLPQGQATNPIGELKILPLGELLTLPEGSEELTLANCIGAIGGALRVMDAA